MLAKRFYSLTLVFSFSLIVVLSLSTVLARAQIANFFAADVDVRELTARIFFIVGIMSIFDGLQSYLQGPIKAMGLQLKASCIAIASFYLVGVPLAVLATFRLDFGITGLFCGFLIASFIQCASYHLLIAKQDW